MPVCKSCFKGFNSDLNICPYCDHDQSKKSYRLILMIFFLTFSTYLMFLFSTQKITVKVDGEVYSNYLVLTGNKINSDVNNGEIRIFHLFNHDQTTVFLKEFNELISVENGKDCVINIDSKAKVINVKSGNFFFGSELIRGY